MKTPDPIPLLLAALRGTHTDLRTKARQPRNPGDMQALAREVAYEDACTQISKLITAVEALQP
jgi:DNA-binding FrmR family transcriptional regulator